MTTSVPFGLRDEALADRLSERLALVEGKLRETVATSDGLIERASRRSSARSRCATTTWPGNAGAASSRANTSVPSWALIPSAS